MAAYKSPIVKRRPDDERDGILFYILPPLLLGAVFAFCAMANSDNAGAEAPAPAAEVADEE